MIGKRFQFPKRAEPFGDAKLAQVTFSKPKRTARTQALGASLDLHNRQVNVGAFSKHATRIQVELFTQAQGQEARWVVPLARGADGQWKVEIPFAQLKGFDPKAPLFYGFRAWGPNFEYDPSWKPGSMAGFKSDVDDQGNRFNPNKLLLDPYAVEQSHDAINVHNLNFNFFKSGHEGRHLDSAHVAPKGVVLPPQPLEVRPPKPVGALKDDVVYEVHVRGLTMNDPSVPPELRGTFAGAALKAEYLKKLGVTAVEFLPVQETQNDQNGLNKGTEGNNYWGYMTSNYFSPDRRYAADKGPGGPTREFKAMVDAFHAQGIKVFTDVVYNHTGEGGTHGDPDVATIQSFRGLDNSTYYSLSGGGKYFYDNTGCGANFNTANQAVADLVVDSTRYLVEELGVDGLRFDLASVLGNTVEHDGFNFDTKDPQNLLNRLPRELGARPEAGGAGVDLIAEPWAIGGNSYQVGHFPQGWAEWNGHYRDNIRRHQNMLGLEPLSMGVVAAAVSGSADLYETSGRHPSSSVNFLVAHDGFTLADLYRYNEKQNVQLWPYGPSDGGEDHNNSWDHGGDAAQQRQAARSGLALLMLSSGVPMITGGDEYLRTQHGNNNVYNLDTEKNWLNPKDIDENRAFYEFSQNLIRFRREHPALRPSNFFEGRDHNGNGVKDITWYTAQGAEADAGYMDNPANAFLAWRLDGTEVPGETAPSIYVAYNGAASGADVHLPQAREGMTWKLVSDTAEWMETSSNWTAVDKATRIDGDYYMHERSVSIFVEVPAGEASKG